MRRTLTDAFIRAVPPAAPGKRAHYWDALIPGFGLRVTATGAKSFILRKRWRPHAQPERRYIGDATKVPLTVARAKAREWLQLAAQGIDPKAQARVAAQVTFATVATAWLEDEVRTQRKAAEVARDVRREFIPLWGNRPITAVTTLDIREVVKAKAATAPAQARNLLGYSKRLFGWAVEQHIYGLTKIPPPNSRPPSSSARKLCANACSRMWRLPLCGVRHSPWATPTVTCTECCC